MAFPRGFPVSRPGHGGSHQKPWRSQEAIGAKCIDLEWVQVHPTGLVKPDDADAKIKFLAAEVRPGMTWDLGGTWVGLGPGLEPGRQGGRCCGVFFVTKSLGKRKPADF